MTIVTPVQHPDLDVLLDQLSQALEDSLLSIVLYGSAARGDYEKRTSDINLIVVVAQLTPRVLEQMSPALLRWESRGQPLPRLFTARTIADSVDVFPIEFLELQACRQVLVGSDPFANIQVNTAHLRLQCERELREKLMRLCEGYVETWERPRRLRRLLIDSYSTFVSLFRGCLWLQDDEVPTRSNDVVRRFCEVASLDPEPFTVVEEMKHGERGNTDERKVFTCFFDALTLALQRVDRFDVLSRGDSE
ncbi:MAG: hypothetical protein CL484_05160 [Acidobacteria bacterium]|mgnify:CR=1 FL=1|nr:hypothetical protein [Acidobacteriota bacterium]|tara:strand:+ start:330 stop:1076 length:747 start_codon:yes stop_codon:yes gene_type:complete